MKATGEVMSIDRAFEPALMKAIRSLEIGAYGLGRKGIPMTSDVQLEDMISIPNDDRLFAIAEAFRRGMMVEEIHALSNTDPWSLHKIEHLVKIENRLKAAAREIAALADTLDSTAPSVELLHEAKRLGFADRQLADYTGLPEKLIRDI